VTGFYHYCYKTVTSIEKTFSTSYNGITSKLKRNLKVFKWS